ncbi:unnamed protein product [Spirodela intermedia]|uniref:Uncharacterized protein n=1 Tax=Spirodela intermedia TaxID=51605 RepID=A0A7I8L7Q6_SPIIN|nr:unnamed protein product [Spirodela intermedia]
MALNDEGNVRRRLSDYARPVLQRPVTRIHAPLARNANFRIDSHVMSMLPIFHGKPSEDPYRHYVKYVRLIRFIMYISDFFPDEHLLVVSSHAPWFAHIVNFLVTRSIPDHWNRHRKDKQQIRFYKAVFIGPPSSRMPTVSIQSAYNARHH